MLPFRLVYRLIRIINSEQLLALCCNKNKFINGGSESDYFEIFRVISDCGCLILLLNNACWIFVAVIIKKNYLESRFYLTFDFVSQLFIVLHDVPA